MLLWLLLGLESLHRLLGRHLELWNQLLLLQRLLRLLLGLAQDLSYGALLLLLLLRVILHLIGHRLLLVGLAAGLLLSLLRLNLSLSGPTLNTWRPLHLLRLLFRLMVVLLLLLLWPRLILLHLAALVSILDGSAQVSARVTCELEGGPLSAGIEGVLAHNEALILLV